MESKDYFGNYTLSTTTLNKLREVDYLLKCDQRPADVAWSIIKPKEEEKDESKISIKKEVEDDIDEKSLDKSVEGLATQYFYSQRDRESSPSAIRDVELLTEWLSVAESLLESMESTSDTIQLDQLKNLSDDEVENVIKYLSEKLSLNGTYNLCHSLCAIDVEQSMRYIKMTCSNLLLQKIIDLEKSSRLINTVIQELVEKFPEDVQEFIYAPMLNTEIRDTSVFSTLIDSCSPQKKINLILIFITTVQELKDWHINVLSQLITLKITDNVLRDKLFDLLLEKASVYSRDKNYGKFILSLMKINVPFSDSEKRKLSEIVAVNETLFKRGMEFLLTNMYLHGDLWHIN